MTTMTRTDEHSPTNMDPEAYEYVYAFDNQAGAVTETEQDWRRIIHAGIAKSPMADRGTSQCHHCGAHIRYVAIMKHLPTGAFIAVGEQCLDNRFSLASKADFDRLRKAAALDRQQQRIKTAAAEFVDGITDAGIRNALDRNTDLDELLEHHDYAIRTVGDIRRKLWNNYGDLSERQVAFVGRLLAEAIEKQEKAAMPVVIEPTVPAPEGRIEIEGLVISRKWRDDDYGGSMKITVKVDTPDGYFLVWCTEPAAITSERGDMVALTATLKRSDSKDFFAFGKRPSKARITQEQAVTEENMPTALDD